VIIATDGFWDYVPNRLAMESTVRFIKRFGEQVEQVCKELVNLAKMRGSCDDITVCLVIFHDERTTQINSST